MKIGMVSPSHEIYGGGQIYLSSIKKEIEQLGYTVDILSSDNVYPNSVNIKRIDTWFNKFKNCYSIIKLLKKNKYDRIILNDINISMFSLFFKVFGFKVYSLIHMEVAHTASITKPPFKGLLVKTRSFLINSGSLAIFSVNKANDDFFSKSKNCFVGNLLPELKKINVNKVYEDKIYDYIFIGRLDLEKNIFSLLDFFLFCKERSPGFKAVIVGDGPLKESLCNYNKKLGLDGIVIFNGFADRDSIGELFEASKCNVLYSITEGFPTTILEAAFYNVPSLVTGVGSCKYIANMYPNIVNTFSIESPFEEVFHKGKALQKSFSNEDKKAFLDEYSRKNVTNKIIGRMK